METNTTLAMESLLAIDAEKSKIQAVEKALRVSISIQKSGAGWRGRRLQEVENWSHLTSDMEEVFGSGDVELMATRLKTLQNSLHVMGRKVGLRT